MADEPGGWRDFALTLADRADRIALDHFGGQLPARRKVDGSPVTAADEAIERALRDELARCWPGHAVLGEEEGGALDPERPTWVIDPIDATKNFMRGIPIFATLISVVQAGHPVAGVVSAPALGQRWDAAAGQGARCNGAAVSVSEHAALRDCHVLHGGLGTFRSDPAMWDRLGRISDAVWRTRGFGDFWMALLVAGGHAEAVVERGLSLWDIAAPACLVTEAGGRVTTWDGGPVLGGSGELLASNGACHDAVMALLADGGVGTSH
ncbi:MAG: inositol monophosphatase family protein [Egibacteraceae bacterium]